MGDPGATPFLPIEDRWVEDVLQYYRQQVQHEASTAEAAAGEEWEAETEDYLPADLTAKAYQLLPDPPPPHRDGHGTPPPPTTASSSSSRSLPLRNTQWSHFRGLDFPTIEDAESAVSLLLRPPLQVYVTPEELLAASRLHRREEKLQQQQQQQHQRAKDAPSSSDEEDDDIGASYNNHISALTTGIVSNPFPPLPNSNEPNHKKPSDLPSAGGGSSVHLHPPTNFVSCCLYRGIRNLGNTCYLNSVLQLLSSIAPLRRAILAAGLPDGGGGSENALLLRRATTAANGAGDGTGGGGAPSAAAERAKKDDEDDVRAGMTLLESGLKEALAEMAFSRDPAGVNVESFARYLKLDPRLQQDAAECLTLLLDWLEQSGGSRMKRVVEHTLQGTLLYDRRCKSCKRSIRREESFLYLSIPVCKTLEEGVAKALTPEEVEGFECSGCGQRIGVTSYTYLRRLPPTLCMHFNRFEYDMARMERKKVNTPVSFPQQLDMTHWRRQTKEVLAKLEAEGKTKGPAAAGAENKTMRDDDDDEEEDGSRYELVGVLHHIGQSAYSGHYTFSLRVDPDEEAEVYERLELEKKGGRNGAASATGMRDDTTAPYPNLKRSRKGRSAAAGAEEAAGDRRSAPVGRTTTTYWRHFNDAYVSITNQISDAGMEVGAASPGGAGEDEDLLYREGPVPAPVTPPSSTEETSRVAVGGATRQPSSGGNPYSGECVFALSEGEAPNSSSSLNGEGNNGEQEALLELAMQTIKKDQPALTVKQREGHEKDENGSGAPARHAYPHQPLLGGKSHLSSYPLSRRTDNSSGEHSNTASDSRSSSCRGSLGDDDGEDGDSESSVQRVRDGVVRHPLHPRQTYRKPIDPRSFVGETVPANTTIIGGDPYQNVPLRDHTQAPPAAALAVAPPYDAGSSTAYMLVYRRVPKNKHETDAPAPPRPAAHPLADKQSSTGDTGTDRARAVVGDVSLSSPAPLPERHGPHPSEFPPYLLAYLQRVNAMLQKAWQRSNRRFTMALNFLLRWKAAADELFGSTMPIRNPSFFTPGATTPDSKPVELLLDAKGEDTEADQEIFAIPTKWLSSFGRCFIPLPELERLEVGFHQLRLSKAYGQALPPADGRPVPPPQQRPWCRPDDSAESYVPRQHGEPLTDFEWLVPERQAVSSSSQQPLPSGTHETDTASADGGSRHGRLNASQGDVDADADEEDTSAEAAMDRHHLLPELFTAFATRLQGDMIQDMCCPHGKGTTPWGPHELITGRQLRFILACFAAPSPDARCRRASIEEQSHPAQAAAQYPRSSAGLGTSSRLSVFSSLSKVLHSSFGFGSISPQSLFHALRAQGLCLSDPRSRCATCSLTLAAGIERLVYHTTWDSVALQWCAGKYVQADGFLAECQRSDELYHHHQRKGVREGAWKIDTSTMEKATQPVFINKKAFLTWRSRVMYLVKHLNDAKRYAGYVEGSDAAFMKGPPGQPSSSSRPAASQRAPDSGDEDRELLGDFVDVESSEWDFTLLLDSASPSTESFTGTVMDSLRYIFLPSVTYTGVRRRQRSINAHRQRLKAMRAAAAAAVAADTEVCDEEHDGKELALLDVWGAYFQDRMYAFSMVEPHRYVEGLDHLALHKFVLGMYVDTHSAPSMGLLQSIHAATRSGLKGLCCPPPGACCTPGGGQQGILSSSVAPQTHGRGRRKGTSDRRGTAAALKREDVQQLLLQCRRQLRRMIRRRWAQIPTTSRGWCAHGHWREGTRVIAVPAAVAAYVMHTSSRATLGNTAFYLFRNMRTTLESVATLFMGPTVTATMKKAGGRAAHRGADALDSASVAGNDSVPVEDLLTAAGAPVGGIGVGTGAAAAAAAAAATRRTMERRCEFWLQHNTSAPELPATRSPLPPALVPLSADSHTFPSPHPPSDTPTESRPSLNLLPCSSDIFSLSTTSPDALIWFALSEWESQERLHLGADFSTLCRVLFRPVEAKDIYENVARRSRRSAGVRLGNATNGWRGPYPPQEPYGAAAAAGTCHQGSAAPPSFTTGAAGAARAYYANAAAREDVSTTDGSDWSPTTRDEPLVFVSYRTMVCPVCEAAGQRRLLAIEARKREQIFLLSRLSTLEKAGCLTSKQYLHHFSFRATAHSIESLFPGSSAAMGYRSDKLPLPHALIRDAHPNRCLTAPHPRDLYALQQAQQQYDIERRALLLRAQQVVKSLSERVAEYRGLRTAPSTARGDGQGNNKAGGAAGAGGSSSGSMEGMNAIKIRYAKGGGKRGGKGRHGGRGSGSGGLVALQTSASASNAEEELGASASLQNSSGLASPSLPAEGWGAVDTGADDSISSSTVSSPHRLGLSPSSPPAGGVPQWELELEVAQRDLAWMEDQEAQATGVAPLASPVNQRPLAGTEEQQRQKSCGQKPPSAAGRTPSPATVKGTTWEPAGPTDALFTRPSLLSMQTGVASTLGTMPASPIGGLVAKMPPCRAVRRLGCVPTWWAAAWYRSVHRGVASDTLHLPQGLLGAQVEDDDDDDKDDDDDEPVSADAANDDDNDFLEMEESETSSSSSSSSSTRPHQKEREGLAITTTTTGAAAASDSLTKSHARAAGSAAQPLVGPPLSFAPFVCPHGGTILEVSWLDPQSHFWNETGPRRAHLLFTSAPCLSAPVAEGSDAMMSEDRRIQEELLLAPDTRLESATSDDAGSAERNSSSAPWLTPSSPELTGGIGVEAADLPAPPSSTAENNMRGNEQQHALTETFSLPENMWKPYLRFFPPLTLLPETELVEVLRRYAPDLVEDVSRSTEAEGKEDVANTKPVYQVRWDHVLHVMEVYEPPCPPSPPPQSNGSSAAPGGAGNQSPPPINSKMINTKRRAEPYNTTPNAAGSTDGVLGTTSLRLSLPTCRSCQAAVLARFHDRITFFSSALDPAVRLRVILQLCNAKQKIMAQSVLELRGAAAPPSPNVGPSRTRVNVSVMGASKWNAPPPGRGGAPAAAAAEEEEEDAVLSCLTTLGALRRMLRRSISMKLGILCPLESMELLRGNKKPLKVQKSLLDLKQPQGGPLRSTPAASLSPMNEERTLYELGVRQGDSLLLICSNATDRLGLGPALPHQGRGPGRANAADNYMPSQLNNGLGGVTRGAREAAGLSAFQSTAYAHTSVVADHAGFGFENTGLVDTAASAVTPAPAVSPGLHHPYADNGVGEEEPMGTGAASGKEQQGLGGFQFPLNANQTVMDTSLDAGAPSASPTFLGVGAGMKNGGVSSSSGYGGVGAGGMDAAAYEDDEGAQIACPVCTFLNASGMMRCEMCDSNLEEKKRDERAAVRQNGSFFFLTLLFSSNPLIGDLVEFGNVNHQRSKRIYKKKGKKQQQQQQLNRIKSTKKHHSDPILLSFLSYCRCIKTQNPKE
eukprot:gene7004-4967_t